MRTVYAFVIVSIDGFHATPDGGTDWFASDDEFEEYAAAQGDAIDTIVMGRRTFELMASYWPTPQAYADDPVVAGFMNDLPKVVASRTTTQHPWGPTTFVADDVVGHVRALRAAPGKDVAIFGSSSLVASLLPTGVVDELRVVVQPTVLGAGLRFLDGADGRTELERLDVREFRNGNTLLTLRPVPHDPVAPGGRA